MLLEKESYDISYCTVSMNRAEHVKKTLTQNIQNNLNNNVEFLLLDYNSKDDLESWIKKNMKQHIESGKLKYFKTFEPTHFDRSHSRNMVFKQAKGKYVCNVDADNYIGKGFSEYIMQEFAKNKNCYIGADLEGEYYDIMDAYGRFCCEKSVFMSLRGYDESLKGYGPEDKDLFSRLEKSGLSKITIQNTDFLKAIKHSNNDRICNEFLSTQLKDVYISHINPYLSKVLITLKNNTYNLFEIEPNKYKSVIIASLVQGTFEEGNVSIEQESILLKTKSDSKKLSKKTNDTYTLDGVQTSFTKNMNQKFREKVLIDIPLIINQEKMHENMRKNRKKVNEKTFGNGTFFKNFNQKITSENN